MSTDRQLGDLLGALIDERGMTLDKLAALTNVPKRYLLALVENDAKRLPPAPYVRGYLGRIAVALGVEPEQLREAYTRAHLKSSGKRDELPKNRFALPAASKRWIWVGFGVLLLVVLLSFRAKKLLGIPALTVELPETPLMTTVSPFAVRGAISPSDSLTLNRERVYTRADGSFEKEALLEEGLNTFEFRVKRFLGREVTVTRQVFYQTSVSEPPSNGAKQTAPVGE